MLYAYSITDLGTLGGATSFAYAINNNGDIVGTADTDAAGDSHAFLRPSGGANRDLGTLALGTTSTAFALNTTNPIEVVGESTTTIDGVFLTHAFFYDGTRMTDLNTINAITGNSHAKGINNAGAVTGFSNYIDRTYDPVHAFRYQNGTMTDLGTVQSGDNSNGNAIDNSAPNPIVVGASQKFSYPGCSQPNYHALEWQNSVKTDLGTVTGGHESHAFGINASGQVTGDSSNGDVGPCYNAPPHAFLYDSSWNVSMKQLDANVSWIAQSRGVSVNASGEVVGNYSPNSNDLSLTDGFFFDGAQISKLISLIDPNAGWSRINAAAGINDSAQIVGQGTHNGVLRAFRMDPVRSGPDVGGPSRFPALADFASPSALASALIGPAAAPATAPGNPDQQPCAETMATLSGSPSPTESAAAPVPAQQRATAGSVDLAVLDMELMSWSGSWDDALGESFVA